MTNPTGLRPSRRLTLLGGLSVLASSCRSQPTASSEHGAEAQPARGAASPPSDGVPELATLRIFEPPERAAGGVAVVLLHGFGATGDDLVPLARQLARPSARFFVPAAPLTESASGRAWWHFDAQRPPHAESERLPEGFRLHPQLQLVRRAVQRLLEDVRARYAPRRLVLGGFSQGAMLSLDVALQGAPLVDGVAVLSGALLVDSLPALERSRPPLPRVLITHGQQDPILPFAGAELTRRALENHGYSVQFQPFQGGHRIPAEVATALQDFIYDGA